jgi:pteridine reductase
VETRVALVTGSGRRRVGWFVADALSRGGYRIVLHYRTAQTEAEQALVELRARGVETMAVRADLAHEEEVKALFGEIRDRFGRLDVVVNSAAIWERKRLEEVTAADVRAHFDSNVLGTFLCSREAGQMMVAQPEGGCIINMGDWAEARPYLNHAAYFASKGCIPTLTRCLAVELGVRNPRVRVNCVLPGPVMLPSDLSEDERQEAIGATLVKREGRPENIAQAILALVENDFITGACLPVDGGRTTYALGI